MPLVTPSLPRDTPLEHLAGIVERRIDEPMTSWKSLDVYGYGWRHLPGAGMMAPSHDVPGVEETATDVPIEPRALPLQCGFAMTSASNLCGDDQRRQMEHVVETSQPFWNSPPRGVLCWHVPMRRGAMP